MAQVFYIHPDNPQKRLLEQVVDILNHQGVIVLPTDSGYALGCLIDNKAGMDRICHLRQIDRTHHLTLMCKDLSELASYARVDNVMFRLLKQHTPGRYVFILEASKEVPRRVLNEKRKTIGLRVPENHIAQALLALLDKPLLTTSLILPQSNGEQASVECDPDEIEDKIGAQIDALINGGYLSADPTSVIDLTEGYPTIIRVGSGDVRFFE